MNLTPSDEILPNQPADSREPNFALRFTNKYNDVFYFVSLGSEWPERSECRLISETTADKLRATRFETAPEAVAVLVSAGEPDKAGLNWEVVEI